MSHSDLMTQAARCIEQHAEQDRQSGKVLGQWIKPEWKRRYHAELALARDLRAGAEQAKAAAQAVAESAETLKPSAIGELQIRLDCETSTLSRLLRQPPADAPAEQARDQRRPLGHEPLTILWAKPRQIGEMTYYALVETPIGEEATMEDPIKTIGILDCDVDQDMATALLAHLRDVHEGEPVATWLEV